MSEVIKNKGDNIIFMKRKRKKSKNVKYFESDQEDAKDDKNFEVKYKYYPKNFDNDRYKNKNVQSKEKKTRIVKKPWSKKVY
jgi:hypothetical protein